MPFLRGVKGLEVEPVGVLPLSSLWSFSSREVFESLRFREGFEVVESETLTKTGVTTGMISMIVLLFTLWMR